MYTIKVLHVIARMNVGGTARYIHKLVEEIPNSGLAVGNVQEQEIEDSTLNELQIYRIPHLGRRISPIQDVHAWLELRALVKRLKPDIVHTHTFKAGLIGRLVDGGHKRVHTFHGHLFNDQSFSNIEKKVISFIEAILAKRTDVLISVGEKVGKEVRAAGVGIDRAWVSVPPGIAKLVKLEKSSARASLGLDSQAFLIGWMARMTSVKNPFLMLEVARRMPTIQFVMAGGGDLFEKVRLNAPSNVSVIGWSHAATFWSAVDCALSTSDNEGMPIALIEAQLAGVPVVATNVGSVSEVISNRVTGIISDQNVESIVNALEALILDRKLLRSMSVAAAEFSSQNFTVDTMLSSHQRIYNNLLGHRIN